jgi:rhodanese-related sulfurtransferase
MTEQTIDVEALRALLASDELYACLDVRERGEFALQQIAGTTPLARGTLEYRAPPMVPRRNLPVVVLCDDGRRSALAADTLRATGYATVRVLAGGLQAWVARGLPTREGWGVHSKEYGERVAVDLQVPQITAKELAARRGRGEAITVVDVRTDEEYWRGHVPDAWHVPGGNLLLEVPGLLDQLDSALVISCAGRTRGILGAQLLREAGLRNVSALLNGAMGWRLAGLDLELGGGRGRPGGARTVPDWVIQATERLGREACIERLDVEALVALQGAPGPCYVVDVRLPAEYRAGHIPGAVSLPAGQAALMHENLLAVRRAPVVVVADDPIRPIWAAALLQRLGFPSVRVLDGGLAAWTAQGRALEHGDAPGAVYGLDEARRQVRALAPAAVDALRAGEPAPLVLDVRGSGEFGVGHLPGARWLARGKLELGVDALAPDRERPILVTCDTGVRSTLAAATLQRLGHQDVAVLDGGLNAWQAAGRSLEEGLEGADVSVAEAQADFGHTLWSGTLGRSRADMEHYLTWEENLAQQQA